VEPEETSIASQRLSKQVSAATDTQTAVEKLFGMMFSVRPLRSGNKRRELVNWCSVGSRAMKKRLYVCCSTVICGVRGTVIVTVLKSVARKRIVETVIQ
jgi:hypothetical protein